MEIVNFNVGGRRPLALRGCAVMAIINVTPDSFSDGGDYLNTRTAAAAAIAAFDAGALIVDIGGESTRPGAGEVNATTEIDRVVPVIRNIMKARPQSYISIDTRRAEVAIAAARAGASMINDVSGLRFDPSMVETAEKLQLPILINHSRGTPSTMNDLANYTDVVAEVLSELTSAVDLARAAGIPNNQILIDPGLGFAKNANHNWEILKRLREFTVLGFPVVVGPSRKRFLGELLNNRPPKERDDATLATVVLAAQAGAAICRVHHVQGAVDAVAVVGRCVNLHRLL